MHETKASLLIRQFELFKMEDGETIEKICLAYFKLWLMGWNTTRKTVVTDSQKLNETSKNYRKCKILCSLLVIACPLVKTIKVRFNSCADC